MAPLCCQEHLTSTLAPTTALDPEPQAMPGALVHVTKTCKQRGEIENLTDCRRYTPELIKT